MKKIVYVPIEIKSREFLAKVVLALNLANNNYQVVVGKSTEVEKLCTLGPRGIYLGTSIMKQHNEIFKRIRKRGSKIVAADEEGLVYYNEEDFKRNKINEQSLSNLDTFIVWGKHHEDLVCAKCQDMSGKIRRIGNIRMEILKRQYRFLYEDIINEIQKKYGRYILINTNFGAYNHYDGEKKYLEIARNLAGEDKRESVFRIDKIKHQHTVFESFIKLANRLEKEFTDINIIVRPHPSESVERWKNILNGSRIRVIREGNVLPWIMASECVIQQNCTTAIEALCMEKPVFSYLPAKDDRFDAGLPNMVTPVFEKEDDLVISIGNVITNEENYQNLYKTYKKNDLSNYISGLDENSNVFDEYIDVFDKVTDIDNTNLNLWSLIVKYRLYNIVSMMLNKTKRAQMKYITQKYPHTSFESWEKLVDLINKRNDGKYTSIKLKKVAEDTYLVYS
mgnify:CR=1 FL=1